MSVKMVKDKEVTVITVAVDKNSMLPPVCQILKALCYNPTCCLVYRGMMETSVAVALGVIQIMVGLFSIGLGPGRTSRHPEDFAHLGVAYWLGGVFILSGLMSVLAGRFSSVCLVSLAVLMNLLGSVFSIVGIVMYSIDLSEIAIASRFYLSQTERLLVGMDITMMIMTVLQLCVCISFAVLGIKALINPKSEEVNREGQWYKHLDTDPLKAAPGHQTILYSS
ncbi:membrane-spanning 4-domains subfamily A member 4A-like [Cheilinus undulatus]|uniref:membrane-spanning 4-domains subfamily A member 4A-like n=1 Tax=Cheilinus undulatus TaxID=241271 RepID=UPI001BD3EEFF|nr:membrane-spanning 4-domains subfamily A member 4A-like [Cheilinus undulatus]XP_041648643.1 membrane-spanning 4-domains subfamily A member 4A-like [Cheilinus undulatus]